MVFLVPFDGEFHSSFQRIMWMIAQLVHGWLNVTSPVALFQDVVLVIVERRHLSGYSADVFAEECYDAQNPDRSFDTQHPRIVKFLSDQVAECSRLINTSITEEVFSAIHTMIESEEDGLHHVLYIYEGDVLALVSHGKVHMLLDAFCHQEIVFLSWTIYAGRSQDDIRELDAEAIQIFLCFPFALAVSRVRVGRIMFRDFLIRLFFSDGTEDAERADEYKPLDRHLEGDKRTYEIFGTLGVHPIEIFCMQTLGSACRMNHIVELLSV